jgi:glycosyltransferase involved in cell wall biosynthesis
MRVDELRGPLETGDDRGTVLAVDPEGGFRAYASALRVGRRQIERHRSSAVLVYRGGLLGAVGMALSLYCGVPLLVRLNGDIYRQHREKAIDQVREREWRALVVHLALMLLTRAIFWYAHGFVPVSETLTDVVHRQTGCPKECIVPVPNPVPVDDYQSSEPGTASRSESGATLLTVTNLSFRGKYEGVRELIDAVVPVLRARPSAEYCIAGDGRYYERLRRYLDEHVGDDVREQIRAVGHVADVETLYREADVFVYASHIEGYPNVILEAQAAGLPIVTNSAYGITEQIDDGRTGLLVESIDDTELPRLIESLLDDSAERERLGRNARQRVEAENVDDVIGDELHRAVARIVNECN